MSKPNLHEVIRCACGCGQSLTRWGIRPQSKQPYERKFIHGHNARKNGSSQRPLLRNVQQELILCACGCGRSLERYAPVKDGTLFYERHYIHNHHAKFFKLSKEHKRKLLAARKTKKFRRAWLAGMRRRGQNYKWRQSVSVQAARQRWNQRGRLPLLYFQCAFCGAECERVDLVHRRQTVHRFCSNECKWKFYRGEQHPNYVGGLRAYPYEWTNELKRQVKRRDKYACQRCGLTDVRKLCVHHKDNDKSNCKLSNLITLCRSCHRKVHARMRKAA